VGSSQDKNQDPIKLTGSAPSAERLKEMVAKGISYLLDKQNKDGCWPSESSGYGYSVAVLCANALLNHRQVDPERVDAALVKSLKWLQGTRSMFGTWDQAALLSFMVDLDSFEAKAFLSKDKIKELSQKNYASLDKAQLTSQHKGGWPYGMGGGPASFLASWITLALLKAKEKGVEVDDKKLAAAGTFLKKLELQTGYFFYGAELVGSQTLRERIKKDPGRILEGLGRVCGCNLVLYLLGERKKEDLDKTVDYFFEKRDLVEKARLRAGTHQKDLHGIAPYYYFFSHYQTTLCLKHTSGDLGRKYRTLLRELLDKIQEPDGSWRDWDSSGRAYGTAMALLMIAELGKQQE
jgi:hypothetical protein